MTRLYKVLFFALLAAAFSSCTQQGNHRHYIISDYIEEGVVSPFPGEAAK